MHIWKNSSANGDNCGFFCSILVKRAPQVRVVLKRIPGMICTNNAGFLFKDLRHLRMKLTSIYDYLRLSYSLMPAQYGYYLEKNENSWLAGMPPVKTIRVQTRQSNKPKHQCMLQVQRMLRD